MTTEPNIEPPNCTAVLTNWRIFSTVLNSIGKEKVILPTLEVQSVENTAETTKQSNVMKGSHQDAQPIDDAQQGKELNKTVQELAQVTQTVIQVIQPVQIAQPDNKETKDVLVEEQPMEVDQCNRCESEDLASGRAFLEEAILLGSPSKDVRSVSSSILENLPKSTPVKDFGTPYKVAG